MHNGAHGRIILLIAPYTYIDGNTHDYLSRRSYFGSNNTGCRIIYHIRQYSFYFPNCFIRQIILQYICPYITCNIISYHYKSFIQIPVTRILQRNNQLINHFQFQLLICHNGCHNVKRINCLICIASYLIKLSKYSIYSFINIIIRHCCTYLFQLFFIFFFLYL